MSRAVFCRVQTFVFMQPCTVMAYICQWEVTGSCHSSLLVLKALREKKGALQAPRWFVSLTWTAAMESNRRQMKPVSEPRCGSVNRRRFTLMQRRFKWADGEVLTRPSPSLPQKVGLKRRSEAFLSERILAFTWIKRNHAVRAAGRDMFNGHKLKLG